MSDELPAIRRQLKIKSGSVARLWKEYNMYRKEAEEQKVKVDKMIEDAADEYELRNAQRILAESERMIDDTSKRVGKSAVDLREIVVVAQQHPELLDQEEYMKALQVMQESAM
ncbi:tubulin binding cofactor A [Schizophyllum amplum]|uniref:Tubulin-specific chaperone A n=1 Tax=Schizophyllum amplum TaxID=97359 RepID=A0A550CLY7_9AGAR|nr:tubulin binding cofactor A [Auriculariopsis ampla]